MSNTLKELAEKGSKYWIQKIINTEYLRQCLDNKIGLSKIMWVSPLEHEQYKEYELIKSSISTKLGIDANYIQSFWPNRGPQWDALGKVDDGTVILLEAKAYCNEYRSRTDAEDPSLALIKDSLKKTHDGLYATIPFQEEIWLYKFYQTANRLAFWYFLNRKYKVILVFLNIINDCNKKTSEQEWKTHNQEMISSLLGNAPLPSGVKIIQYDVKANKFLTY